MVKKKGKGKAKGKGKKGKKEEKEKKTKRPTEKELFEMQICELRERLESTSSYLEEREVSLEHARNRLDSEVESESACVSHLKRVLRWETDHRLDVQERLQTERDLSELAERRALEKIERQDRSGKASKSLFLQQKTELEGKLSLLEEQRLERNSQRDHMRRAEEALDDKRSLLKKEGRQEEARRVDSLLRNRETFLSRCRDLRREWREAFELRLPVHAEKQLEENVGLRGVCSRNTEELLRAQERSRKLKQLQKSLNLEEEIQSSVEESAIKRKLRQAERLRSVLSQIPPGLVSEVVKERSANLDEDHGVLRIFEEVQKDRLSSDVDQNSRGTAEQVLLGWELNKERLEPSRVFEKSYTPVSNIKWKSSREEQISLDMAFMGQQRPASVTLDEDIESLQISKTLHRTKDLPSEDADGQRINRVKQTTASAAEQMDESSEENGNLSAEMRKDSEIPLPQENDVHERSDCDWKDRVIHRRLESIREQEIEKCSLEDRMCDVATVLEDQTNYKRRLEGKLQEIVDRNGAMMSSILRAGKVMQTRSGKVDQPDTMDFDVLHQIRILLDMTSQEDE